jgi:short-subunit dehydrogenase
MKPQSPETVLVTGASSGIGLELARCFAAEKCHLVLVARNTSALEKLAAELRGNHSIRVRVLTADLARPETPSEIFDELDQEKISVDVLVNNAGFGLHGTFAELPLNTQLEMVQVNVTALTHLTGLFLPGMIGRRRGGILNVGSVAGFLPGPNMTVYYATKAFVMSFSEALRVELQDTGVTVTDLCPGPTATNFSQVARSHRTRKVHYGKMSAAEVARSGHAAFRQGRVLSVPGFKNKILTLLPRIFSRSFIARVSGRYNQLD